MSFMFQSSASEAIRKPDPSRRAGDFKDFISLFSDDEDDDKTVEEDPSGGVPAFDDDADERAFNKNSNESLKKR